MENYAFVVGKAQSGGVCMACYRNVSLLSMTKGVTVKKVEPSCHFFGLPSSFKLIYKLPL